MARKFSALNVAFAGFCIAALGTMTGFIGFGIEVRWVTLVAFVVTVFGVILGFIGVIYGWMKYGGAVIGKSIRAAEELAAKIKRFLKYDDYS